MGVVSKIRDSFEDTSPGLSKSVIDEIIKKMDPVEKDCTEARKQYYTNAKKWVAWTLNDKENMGLNKAGLLKPDGKGKTGDWQAFFHIPIVLEKVMSLIAIIGSDAIEIRYKPKIDAKTYGTLMERLGRDASETPEFSFEEIAKQGNTLFQMYRDHICWHDHMHKVWMELAVLDHVFLRSIVDKIADFPAAVVGLQRLNAWQLFHTVGKSLKDSTEISVTQYFEPEELKAQFPEFADEIGDIKPGETDEKGGRSTKLSKDAGSKDIWADKEMPKYGGSPVRRSKTSIRVREFWQRDSSFEFTNVESDNIAIDSEHSSLGKYIRDPGIYTTMDAIKGLLFDNNQYHTTHIEKHNMMIEEWRKLELDDDSSSARLECINILQVHIERHENAAKDIELEGAYPKYPDGWRQTIILGENNELGIYDGENLYLKYGCKGHPFVEFNLMGWVYHDYGPSYCSTIIDENMIIDSSTNSMVDNLKWTGNNKIIAEESVYDAMEISNNPSVMDKVPDDALYENRFQRVPGIPINPSAPVMIEMMVKMATQTSGIFQTMRGEPGGGVRSGEQAEKMITQNRIITSYRLKRLIGPLTRLAKQLFKMLLHIAPPEDLLNPVIGEKILEIDYELLQEIDFAVDVQIVEGGSNLRMEQMRFLQEFVRSFGPLFMQVPGGAATILEAFAPLLEENAPPELIQAVENLKQMIMQASQQPGENAAAGSNTGLPTGRPGALPGQ